ncbi:hypothetical protein FRB94_011691 [Tulasnella sp. JGI-2019a]|nr:hypothetical protein FRB93_010039 [Tulasnella sp. JGI-2019a]KAG8992373.1 hypothetical protein FRB94_011691 [Tulasnella sp. JGI-2019a]
MNDAKLSVLESLGCYDEAAELQKQLGRDLDAIHSFLKSTNAHSHERGVKSTLEALWNRFHLNTIPPKDDETVQKLLELGKSAWTARSTMEMFNVLQNGTPTQLAVLGRRYMATGDSPAYALMSYDCALRYPAPL